MFYSFSSLDSNKNVTVIGFVSNKSITLLPYRQVLDFLKSRILNKSFQQSSDQSSVGRKINKFISSCFTKMLLTHSWFNYGLDIKTKIDYYYYYHYYQTMSTTGVYLVEMIRKTQYAVMSSAFPLTSKFNNQVIWQSHALKFYTMYPYVAAIYCLFI